MAEDFGLPALLLAPGHHKLANVPEGLEAPLLGKIAAARVLLYVARDDARMSRLAEALRFFAPQLEVFNFPAWDCLPYDRVSPHRDLSAARIDTLTRLLSPAGPGGRVVLTTLNALTQRVPRPQALAFLVTELKPGTRIAPEALIQLLRQNGYLRNDTVGEPGEFAVRGGLIDLYPAGEAQPIRLDFFGDELEKMRRFDPLTQRSIEEVAQFSLKPVSEAQLDPTSIARFRSGYREAFGSVKDDPLYDAISEGRLFPGYEHWLPLFHEGLGLLTDYLPAGTTLMLEPQINDMLRARLALVEDYYQARLTSLRARQDDGAPYRPLPPKSLYLDATDWKKLQAGRSCLELTPFNEPEALDVGGRRALDLAAARGQGGPAVYEAVREALSAALSRGERALITGLSDGSRDRLGHMLGEHGIILDPPARDVSDLQSRPLDRAVLATLPFEVGFSGLGFFVLSEADLLGERLSRPTKKRRRAENFLTEVAALTAGDLVVHLDHGIGRYDGLVTLDVMDAAHDCLKVVYAGGDRLFVPVENIEVLSRFGSEGAGVELDKLGGVSWQQRKAEARKRIRDIARGLIRIAAERQTKEVEPIELPTGTYEEFAARFPYAETDDQLAAISETFEDLAAGHPMDRLICGDVGFGKTEVALRAAFAVAMSGKQVAVVVPTTLLARQHFRTFKGRFEGLPIKVAQLSRLVAPKDAAEVKEAIKEGTVDIVVGTHALLAKSVEFKRLGLLLVDEEQHFGVKQKERMKELRTEVHVLTLTATPIPRTLQLAMSGVKQMSLISTPPVDRLAVRTFVLPYDPVVVREAIMRERFRGGQIFYVAPRLEDLPDLQQRLSDLVPEVKVGVAHGQLSPTALESVMSQFLDGRIDLLLSTNIVESGLDIPNANTLIIHRADMFGLAQLYQLRGRIGRSKQRGYAYLTVPPGRLLTAAAAKRLEVMQTLDTLGAGFQLASHDMDIRGAGNLLGEEQSGHIKEVGIELYQQMLEEAVAGLRRKGAESQSQENWSPQINLGMAVLIPEGYVADLDLRLGLYRRLSTLNDAGEIEAFGAELIDRFGPLPAEVENLLEIMGVKRLCKMTRVAKVDAGPKGAVFAFRDNRPSDPERLLGYIQRSKGRMKIRPDQRLVVVGDWDAAPERLKGVRQVLQLLAGEGT